MDCVKNRHNCYNKLVSSSNSFIAAHKIKVNKINTHSNGLRTHRAIKLLALELNECLNAICCERINVNSSRSLFFSFDSIHSNEFQFQLNAHFVYICVCAGEIFAFEYMLIFPFESMRLPSSDTFAPPTPIAKCTQKRSVACFVH